MRKIRIRAIDRSGVVYTALALMLVLMTPQMGFAAATVLNFDDLPADYILTGTSYAGLTWEQGNAGFDGYIGYWGIPSLGSHPYSGSRNIINATGCSLIGIDFPMPANIVGAYVAGQGDLFTTGVRVHGYFGGQEISRTPWFTNIGATAVLFDMSDLVGVDRIVFESIPILHGGGGFGLDDLTFTPIPEPAGLAALGFVAAALLPRRRAGRRNRPIQEAAL